MTLLPVQLSLFISPPDLSPFNPRFEIKQFKQSNVHRYDGAVVFN
jgi:hypothetical protein